MQPVALVLLLTAELSSEGQWRKASQCLAGGGVNVNDHAEQRCMALCYGVLLPVHGRGQEILLEIIISGRIC